MTPTGWRALIGQFSRTFPAEARAPIRLHDANTFPFTLWPLPAEGLLDPRRPTFHSRLPNAHTRQHTPSPLLTEQLLGRRLLHSRMPPAHTRRSTPLSLPAARAQIQMAIQMSLLEQRAAAEQAGGESGGKRGGGEVAGAVAAVVKAALAPSASGVATEWQVRM